MLPGTEAGVLQGHTVEIRHGIKNCGQTLFTARILVDTLRTVFRGIVKDDELLWQDMVVISNSLRYQSVEGR